MVKQQLEQCAHCLHSRYHGNPIQLFCSKLQDYVMHSAHCGEFQAARRVSSGVAPSRATDEASKVGAGADVRT